MERADASPAGVLPGGAESTGSAFTLLLLLLLALGDRQCADNSCC
jgi:hypothetical protein